MTDEAITAQEVFDKVAAALIEQGGPSEVEGVCRYRGPNGTRCAAGFLIEDADYSEGMEGAPVMEYMLSPIYYPHMRLISLLQLAHDTPVRAATADWRKHWLRKMHEVAESENLSPAILETANG